jgi:hypothetical protein
VPKFTVTVLETTTLNFEIEAVNADEAEKLSYDMDRKLAKASEPTREVASSSRKLEPVELAFKLQIDNIRADYERLLTKQTLPSGETVDDDTAATMMDHLRQMHNNLVLQSGLDIPHISGTSSVVAEHLGEDVITAKKEPIHIDNPEEVWKRCATAFGWEFDPDYKGWIKPVNIKEGARRGEWDAFPRDMTAEDACNEEGIDSVEEAAEALS